MSYKVSNVANRTKLIDEPIVEMLLSRKYSQSGMKFMKSDSSNSSCTDISCYYNGTKRLLNVKRNLSRYYNSPNFTVTIHKNKMDVFKDTTFVFIDEVSDCLYMVDGGVLLQYILEHSDKLNAIEGNEHKAYILIPKRDIRKLISDSPTSIIRYNKAVAKLFELNRDENLYTDLG